MLKRELGGRNMAELDRDRIIRFGRARAEQGAGPVTLGIDIGTIKLVLSHAAAVHGVAVPVEPVDLARIALKRLGLVGKGNERDRRPTDDELARLIAHFDGNPRQIIPMGWIIKFAVATAMRQEEICRVTWSDLNTRTKMLTIRDRKDPREKKGNDQRIPLLAVSGFDALALIENSAPPAATRMTASFPITTSRRERPSPAPVRTSRSRISTSTTCATKARAVCSRRASPSNRWRWSPATRTGRCCGATRTLSRSRCMRWRRRGRRDGELENRSS